MPLTPCLCSIHFAGPYVYFKTYWKYWLLELIKTQLLLQWFLWLALTSFAIFSSKHWNWGQWKGRIKVFRWTLKHWNGQTDRKMFLCQNWFLLPSHKQAVIIKGSMMILLVFPSSFPMSGSYYLFWSLFMYFYYRMWAFKLLSNFSLRSETDVTFFCQWTFATCNPCSTENSLIVWNVLMNELFHEPFYCTNLALYPGACFTFFPTCRGVF